MMPAATRYTIQVLLMLLFLEEPTAAQTSQVDSVKAKKDTLRNNYLPTGVRIGTDIISLVKTQTQNNFEGWELTGEIDFSRYYLVVDYGSWSRDFKTSDLTASYSNEGTYWRAGVDVNFLTKDPDRNVFSLGARYGRSVFSELMTVTVEDPVWGHLDDQFYHADVNAWWIELTSGLRVKIWKILWVGYTGRFKFALSTDASDEMLPHDVPGFGRTDKETAWGFNYYLMIRIPLRTAPPVPGAKD